MSSLQLFSFESQEIRFIDGKPMANDVANVLGYADPAKTVSTKVDSENKSVTKTVTVDGKWRSVTVLEEAGIYQLIFGSKLSSAKKFQQWVFSEVLPSIRKTGGYGTNDPEPQKRGQHYVKRVMDLPKKLKCPPGRWTVIEESSFLLVEVENMGWEINRFDLLDSSVAIRWQQYRDERGLARTAKDAPYEMEGRGTFSIHSYPYTELGVFRQWLKEIYMVEWMPEYLKRKSKALTTNK
jgi:prophage antirepressor-like protein